MKTTINVKDKSKYHELYPKTISEQVMMSDGRTLEDWFQILSLFQFIDGKLYIYDKEIDGFREIIIGNQVIPGGGGVVGPGDGNGGGENGGGTTDPGGEGEGGETGGGTDPTDPEEPEVPTVSFDPINIRNVETFHNVASIKWMDPNDVYPDGDYTKPALVSWKATNLVIKEGSAPESIGDGILKIRSLGRNAFYEKPFIIKDLKFNTTYFIKLFPETKDGKILNDERNSASFTLTPSAIDRVYNEKVDSITDRAFIKWNDPEDKVVQFEGQTVNAAIWAGTKILMKEGSNPISINDGMIVADIKQRNKYKDNPLVINGLTPDRTYYFKFYPYTTDGAITTDLGERYTTPIIEYLTGVDNLSYMNDDYSVTVKWSDPADRYKEIFGVDTLSSKWAGTKLIRKEGSSPSNIEDGTLVVDNVERDRYKSFGFTDDNLAPGKTYYYRLFPYNDSGIVTNSASGSFSVKL